MKPILTLKEERRPKLNLWPSDAGKLAVDILLSLKGIPPTEETEWNSTLRMAAGKGVELQMIKVLKENGIVDGDFDQDKNESTAIEREGVPISMRFDALVKKGGTILKTDDTRLPQSQEITLNEGEPIEIKSINNKNSFDIQKYIDSKPRESYVTQLSIYMDALGKEKGHLFVSAIDGLSYFWFVCMKVSDGIYRCGDTEVDINKVYKRWKEIWDMKDGEIPAELWSEEIYKLPIESIDFTQLSVSRIGDMRNGRYVLGSENKWKIDYSPYSRMIIEKQEVTIGYSEEELAFIREKTKGFSSKKKDA